MTDLTPSERDLLTYISTRKSVTAEQIAMIDNKDLGAVFNELYALHFNGYLDVDPSGSKTRFAITGRGRDKLEKAG
jgi:hypothetical protein